jgi:hypothetical protein
MMRLEVFQYFLAVETGVFVALPCIYSVAAAIDA